MSANGIRVKALDSQRSTIDRLSLTLTKETCESILWIVRSVGHLARRLTGVKDGQV